MKLSDAYNLVAEVASPSDSEGLKKPRAILLLWFLRNVHGIDDLEAYEYVCDGDDDQGVDGLYLAQSETGDDKERLLLFQSKYPEKPKNIGVTEIRELIGTAEPFQSPEGLEELLRQRVAPELERLVKKFDLVEKLRRGQIDTQLVFVTSGKLMPEARRLIKTTNRNRRATFIKAYDVFDLAPTVEAFRSPSTVSGTVLVKSDSHNRFISTIPGGRVAVCRVPVKDIVQWPGIDDRTIFDLNVRRELPRNQVRKALDRAVHKPADHANFIAYHNGLTVVCRKIDDRSRRHLKITDLSIVNGAQSTIAFRENETSLTDNLAVVVKFVQVPSEKQLAREVAIRSNTQNPVTSRNLRARDGVQLRLSSEFATQFPGIVYELRPDASLSTSGHAIQNDEAAQLLCAIYNQAPWIAIKRLTLFDAELYPWVFSPSITASHIVLADLIGRRVQDAKRRFPQEYLRAWRLTRLVGVYLVGQLLRTSSDIEVILSKPELAMAKEKETQATIDRLVRFAAATLKTRRDDKLRIAEQDDFKVDFKREAALKELAGRARNTYVTYATVEEA